jgi:hypothetical protein
MTTILRTVHGREVRSFEELVKELGADAVASPRRSTVPLFDYWRAPEQRLRDLWEHLRVRQPDDVDMHFEHEVPVQRGRGNSSYTDLMIFADDVAVAIEAKFTEPRMSLSPLGSVERRQRIGLMCLRAGFARSKQLQKHQSTVTPLWLSHTS